LLLAGLRRFSAICYGEWKMANGPGPLIAAPSKYLSALQKALALQHRLSIGHSIEPDFGYVIYGLADRRLHFRVGFVLSNIIVV